MATRVYVDSWLLRGMVSKTKADVIETKREFTKLKNLSFTAIIPQIVIGETVTVIMRDYSNDPPEVRNKLSKLYDNIDEVLDISTCIPPPTLLSLQYAEELQSQDSTLTITDLLIVSQALIDPDSQRLLTVDRNLINSTIIKDKEKKLRNEENKRNLELRIVDHL